MTSIATRPQRPLKIWTIQIGEPVPIRPVREMRTAQLSRALAARGHDVVWWASAFDHFSKSWIGSGDEEHCLSPNLRVRLLAGCGYRSNVSLRRFLDHRLVARAFRATASSLPLPNLVIASMPTHDLAFEAYRLCAAHRIPLVVDVRDPWPHILSDVLPAPLRPLARLALAHDVKMVRKLIFGAQSVTSMMPSLLRWAQETSGRKPGPQDRVFYLGAEPLRPVKQPNNPMLSSLGDGSGPVFCFIGTFGVNYEPSIIARVARRMRDVPCRFVLAGEGDYSSAVAKLSEGLPNVMLPGWVDNVDIAWILQHSTAAIIPSNTGLDALPNKLFTYLSGGVPVMSSLPGDAREIIEREQVGLHFSVNDEIALEQKLRLMLAKPSLLAEMQRNVRRFFSESLESKKIYQQFAEHVEQVAQLALKDSRL